MKLHKLVRYIYIHMYFCWGSSLILQAMGPSFSNFLVWCLESRNKEHSISPPFSFGKATTRMQGEYSTGFPQNPWFVGLMGWHLHQKFFTKIVETKDQNGPKSQAGVVDYGHEPDVGWCGMALPLLFTFTSWGFFQVDTKFIAKAKKGQCVECKVAGFYWAINAVRSTNLHSVVVVCCCAVLYGEGATKKKKTHSCTCITSGNLILDIHKLMMNMTGPIKTSIISGKKWRFATQLYIPTFYLSLGNVMNCFFSWNKIQKLLLGNITHK